jgi:hypothetical protein
MGRPAQLLHLGKGCEFSNPDHTLKKIKRINTIKTKKEGGEKEN